MAEDENIREEILKVMEKNARERAEVNQMQERASALHAKIKEVDRKADKDLKLLHGREKRLEALYANKDNPDLWNEAEFEDLTKPVGTFYSPALHDCLHVRN